MSRAAGSANGPGGIRFDTGEWADSGALRDALQLGHDQGINGGTVEEHLVHALGFVEIVQGIANEPSRLVDLGSGGGYPGLVLAYFLPATRVTLVEAREKRADFLRRAVYSLELDERVTVYAGEASTLGRGERASVDVVTARSFGTPGITAECAAPLLRVDGCVVVSEPPMSSVAERWPQDSLSQLGLGPATEITGGSTRFVTTKKVAPTPDRYPRSRRQMQKMPAF